MGGMGGMGMGGMGGGYGRGGGGGGYGDDDDDDSSEEDREQRVEDLQELIKGLIAPDTWEPDGTVGSLDVWNDRLIVRHTRSVHRELRDLFEQLRAAKDMQVAVEARFITLTSNFLEQIGVDLDVVLNHGNAGLDYALTGAGSQGGGGTRGIDPTTGQSLLHPRQFTQLGFSPQVAGFGQAMGATAALQQPFQNVGLVPPGSPSNWWGRHTTSVPLVNNTLGMASPRPTGIPGSLAGELAPAFQVFGSFLDNIQVDFLMRATQLDARSSVVDAPRLTVYSGREASITIGTNINYVAQPGQLPVGGTGLGSSAAFGRPPSIQSAFAGRTFRVTPTVSGDRRYVTLELRPQFSSVEFDDFVDTTGPLKVARTTTTNIGTTVTVPDRGWLLLGGLKQSGETEIEAGVPILSKIPILKRAFTNRSKVKDERTLLLLVKPTIIVQGEIEEEAFPDMVTTDATFGG